MYIIIVLFLCTRQAERMYVYLLLNFQSIVKTFLLNIPNIYACLNENSTEVLSNKFPKTIFARFCLNISGSV